MIVGVVGLYLSQKIDHKLKTVLQLVFMTCVVFGGLGHLYQRSSWRLFGAEAFFLLGLLLVWDPLQIQKQWKLSLFRTLGFVFFFCATIFLLDDRIGFPFWLWFFPVGVYFFPYLSASLGSYKQKCQLISWGLVFCYMGLIGYGFYATVTPVAMDQNQSFLNFIMPRLQRPELNQSYDLVKESQIQPEQKMAEHLEIQEGAVLQEKPALPELLLASPQEKDRELGGELIKLMRQNQDLMKENYELRLQIQQLQQSMNNNEK